MYSYQQAKEFLQQNQKVWLITGAAGFIGSNLIETLLKLNQKVIGLDNLYGGKIENLNSIKTSISDKQWQNLNFIKADINNKSECNNIFNSNIDYVIHHAAVCSVPFSIANPEVCYETNINGFTNIIDLTLEYNIENFVYASSSAVYGDNTDEIKKESRIGTALSPYAKSKQENENIAKTYSDKYNLNTTGFRYFNIYGKKQDPNHAYAAVIPKWLYAMLNNNQIHINGDGSTTRDFCYVEDVVQANILSCLNNQNSYSIYNIGTGHSITLNQLYSDLLELLNKNNIQYNFPIEYREFQPGDIKHSKPDISKAKAEINFCPCYDLQTGLDAIVDWYKNDLNQI